MYKNLGFLGCVYDLLELLKSIIFYLILIWNQKRKKTNELSINIVFSFFPFLSFRFFFIMLLFIFWSVSEFEAP